MASPPPHTLPMEGQGRGISGAPNTPGMLPAQGYRQDTQGRDEGASGDQPAAWHGPILKGLPSALIFLPALTLSQPQGAHGLPTASQGPV